MQLKKMFLKDIERDIKGVIKVGQDDNSNVHQELDEYVVTRELQGHFGEFFEAYKKGIVNHTDKMGVWISGFFGSGKSHFLKILSYLLENRLVNDKKAAEYFDDKVHDTTLLADMKKAGDITADVILFNIDSKSDSDSKADKESIVKVFNKVFNEMQGFCGSIPWVADLERQMVKDGVYEEFKKEFEEISGNIWKDAREDFYYEEDSIIEALSRTTKMSEEAARGWYNKAEENYSLSVEKFAQRVKEYIERRSGYHHVLFLVDEIGQYIGDDSQLMLNLQTIVEDLGTYCGGKAWVIVTSQQDIDAVTKVKGNDFSKIQGRFNTRLSLSSANVDEVIKKRLLDKTPGAADSLKLLYEDKSSIIKNLITFSDAAEMKIYKNELEFAEVYPFIPYQFNLLQSVFTGIRVHGASGKHLSEGERSLLSAFQESAVKYVNDDMGIIIPFSAFYETIEAFLDANIRTVIIHAKNNSRLNEEDVEVLKLLFMIKYVKEVPSNLENIATLLVKHIDDDKLEIKKKVEESLKRLIRETLIQKNGEEYIFLTHEEQDVNREIKNITIEIGEVIQKIGEVIFEEIYPDKKFKYSSKYNFPFNIVIDDRARGPQNSEIGIRLLTPWFDSGVELTQQELKLISARENNVIVKLPSDASFLEEMEEALRIQAYLRLKSGTASTQIIEDIKTRKSREVAERKERVKTLLLEALKRAEIFVNSQLLDIKEKNPIDRIDDGLRVLIDSLYNKLNYVKEFVDNSKDLYDILASSNIQMNLIDNELNKLAIQEVNGYIERNSARNIPMTMKSITALYSKAPYGWAELDIAGIIIKLFKSQEIKLVFSSQYLTATDKDVVIYLTKRDYVDRVLIKKRTKTPIKYINNVKDLCKDLFNYSAVPTDEDSLMNRFKELIKGEVANIQELLVNYEQANYPGEDVLIDGKKIFEELLNINDTLEFYEKAFEIEDDFLDYVEYSEDVKKFFKNQRKFFDDALKKIDIYNKNKTYVLDKEADDIIRKMQGIVSGREPYSNIPKLPGLIEEFSNRFTELLEIECKPVRKVIQSDYESVMNELNIHEFKGEFNTNFKKRFDDLLERLDSANNFYEAIAMKEESDRLKIRCFDEISREVERRRPIAPSKLNPDTDFVDGSLDNKDNVTPAYRIRRTKNISIANILHGAKTIESQDDIEELLNDIRKKLNEEFEENTIIKLV
jgi:hypothetical protein